MTSNPTGGMLRRLAKPLTATSIAALVLIGLFAVGSAQEPTQQPSPVASIASSAETPSGTGAPTATPDQNVRTVVRLETDAPQPINRGQVFEVRVMVENVDHLAAFEFAISYDGKKLEPVKAGSGDSTAESTPVSSNASGNAVRAERLGEIFASSPRKDVVSCTQALDQADAVDATCVTRTIPVCVGGPIGASGSGVLGVLFFKSKGGGPTTLTVTKGQLALDNYQDCRAEVQGTKDVLPGDCLPIREEPSDTAREVSCQPDGTSAKVLEVSGDAQKSAWVRLEDLGWASTDHLGLPPSSQVGIIPSRAENLPIELGKAASSSSTLLIIVIGAVAVVVVAAAGVGGYLWYRRRPTPSV